MTEQKVKLVIEPELSMEDINARIKQEVCYETLEELTDEKLLCEYKDCNSVKNEIKKLSEVLGKYMDEETKQIILDFFTELTGEDGKRIKAFLDFESDENEFCS